MCGLWRGFLLLGLERHCETIVAHCCWFTDPLTEHIHDWQQARTLVPCRPTIIALECPVMDQVPFLLTILLSWHLGLMESDPEKLTVSPLPVAHRPSKLLLLYANCLGWVWPQTQASVAALLALIQCHGEYLDFSHKTTPEFLKLHLQSSYSLLFTLHQSIIYSISYFHDHSTLHFIYSSLTPPYPLPIHPTLTHTASTLHHTASPHYTTLLPYITPHC